MLFDSANAETIAFVDRFRARFGKLPSYAAVQGYEAARIAIAAARNAAATAGAKADVQAQRDAVHAFMYRLNGPANAVPGLNGPLWFTPDGGREQPVRIGRFEDGVLPSAPSQLVPVHSRVQPNSPPVPCWMSATGIMCGVSAWFTPAST